LRGQRSDEALDALERYLDSAYLAGPALGAHYFTVKALASCAKPSVKPSASTHM